MKSWVITGGLAAGKSAFAAELRRLGGAYVASFSCDEAARALWGEPVFAREVRTAFGSRVTDTGGGIDRAKLRELVFANPVARQRLEGLSHPRILRDLEAARAAAESSGAIKLFVAEVPLYHEIGASVPADLVIVVAASLDVQRARLMERRNLDAATSEKMLEAQLPLDRKIQAADVVVWNDGGHAILEAQALALLRDRWDN